MPNVLAARDSTIEWLKGCADPLPQLTGLNDLLVKKAADAATLPSHETYLTLRCCSIFVLTSLAQLYDIIMRTPVTPDHEYVKFRGMCDDTLKDIGRITVDFTKEDYSYLEPALSVSFIAIQDSDSTQRILDELGACIASGCGRRRPAVISPVYWDSLVGFPGPGKSTLAHQDIPRREV